VVTATSGVVGSGLDERGRNMRELTKRVVTGAAALLMLTGCGGGADTGFIPAPTPIPTPTPAPTPTPGPTPAPTPLPSARFALSGDVAVPPDAAIDSDTADITTPNGNNDSVSSPQAVANPLTLGGHANRSGDEFDLFAVRLAQGQRVDLAIAEDGELNDLDLFLADRQGRVVAASESITNTESLTAPAAGDYLVAVQAFEGRSNYVLTLRQAARGTPAPHGQRTQSPVIPGEMLVRSAPGATPALKSKLGGMGLSALADVSEDLAVWSLGADVLWPTVLKALDARLAAPGLGFADIETRARHDTLRAMKAVKRMPGVLRVEPNFAVRASLTPNDTLFADQWHYRLINLPQAWDTAQGSSGVRVAVADTGVVLNHPDLRTQLEASDPDGFDFISSSSLALDGDGRDANADDPGDDPSGQGSFHGTHVAGTVAAATNNGTGVAGAGFNSRILPLRVLGRGGGGSSADILAAVRYSAGLTVGGVQAAQPPQILNLSLGCDDCFSASAEEVYRDAAARGLMIAAAAGNSGDSGNPIGYPASYAGVVSVGAVGPATAGGQPRRAPYSQFNRFVDVAAPGGDTTLGPLRQTAVLSTLAQGFGSERRVGYGFLVGTSMATPHVAGVMALMKAVFPALTPAQFDQLLAAGELTTDLGPAGRDDEFGFGLIDAARAVDAARRLAGGGSIPERPALVVQPEQLDFGNSSVTLALAARNAGTGTLTVSGVSDDAPWLSVTAGATQGGSTPITASVNRSGLTAGAYSATITVQSSANTVTVPVLMQVGGVTGNPTAGVHYFLLIDTATFEAVAQQRAEPVGGRYALAFRNVPAGDYQLIGGTDSDEDGFVCDAGEACAVYSTPDLPTTIQVRSADIANLNFPTSFDFATLAASSEGARPPALSWLPREGLRVKPAR
jgi:serine protease